MADRHVDMANIKAETNVSSLRKICSQQYWPYAQNKPQPPGSIFWLKISYNKSRSVEKTRKPRYFVEKFRWLPALLRQIAAVTGRCIKIPPLAHFLMFNLILFKLFFRDACHVSRRTQRLYLRKVIKEKWTVVEIPRFNRL